MFGSPGLSQRWVNILGNVSAPDGVATLTYSLNAGPTFPLSLGPDTRRLAAPGDFNIEIASTALSSGRNHVTITAVDTRHHATVQTVTFDYFSGKVWPLPFAIDWNGVANLQDVVQVVDGLWTVEPHGIRPVLPGYDRTVAIGDMAWSDYEITVPVTIHGIDAAGYRWPSVAPGIGLILRWYGHFDWGGTQPTIGWNPVGATLWYGWEVNRFVLKGDHGLKVLDPSPRKMEPGSQYYFKMRVQTVANDPHQLGWYRAKIWHETEREPSTWNLQGREHWHDLPNGSVLLVAHHVDATFGDVRIIPLEQLAPRPLLALWAERAADGTMVMGKAVKQYLRQLLGRGE